MEINKQQADELPYYLRQQVIDACKKRAELHPLLIGIFIFVCIVFIAAAVFAPMMVVSGFAEYIPNQWIVWLFGLPFLSMPLLFAYLIFVRPKKWIKLAEEEKYSCYIGEVTDKQMKVHRDADGDRHYHYYLYLNGILKCPCSMTEYNDAVIGERQMAIFFGKKEPTYCVKINDEGVYL